MALIKKEDILKAMVSGFREFKSETLGGKVRFKKLSAAGHDAIDNYTTRYRKDGKRERDLTLFRAAFIAASQVDESGDLLWGLDEVETVGGLKQEVVTELFRFALEVNPAGMTGEEVKKDLTKNPDGSSSTD